MTVGEAMLRLATPAGARLASTPALDVYVAGAEANVAAALAGLGISVRWASRLPSNPLGRRVAAALASAGVVTDAIAWEPDGRLGLFFSDTGVAPRPADVTYDRAGSAFTRMATLPGGVLTGARRVHVTGITPAVAPASLLTALLAQTREEGVALSVDVNHRARLWSGERARAALAPLLAAADVVICGAADADTVFGLRGDPDAIAERLRDEHAPDARHVVITLGADGCVGLDAAGTRHERAALPATMVDRFGLGDAFAAGLLWRLLDDGDDLAPALHAAVTLAALKATTLGDFAQTTATELTRAMDATRALPAGVLR